VCSLYFVVVVHLIDKVKCRQSYVKPSTDIVAMSYIVS